MAENKSYCRKNFKLTNNKTKLGMKECGHQGSKVGSILRGFPNGLFRDAGFAF